MKGAAGLVVARGWMNLCSLVSFVLVGRFLLPADFGIYAAASSSVFLFMTVVGAGFAEHVLSRDPLRQNESAAYWCSAATGMFGAVGTIAAGLYAQFVVGNASIAILLYLLAVMPLLWGFSVVSEAVLIRDGQGTKLTGTLVLAETAGLLSLLLAFVSGCGLISLAISRLVSNSIICLGYSFLAGTKIFSPIDRKAVVSMTRFSLSVLGGRFVQWFDGYGSDLILITRLTPAVVGHYRMAARLGAAPASLFFQAPYPAQLAYLGRRLAFSSDLLGSAYLKAAKLHLCLTMPIFAVLSVCARDIVHLVLGPAWQPVGLILTLLLAPAPVGVWSTLSGASLIALGMPKRFLMIQTVSAGLGFVGLLVGAEWGALGAAAGKAVAVVLFNMTALFWVPTLTRETRNRIFAVSLGTAIAALVCAASAYTVLMLVPNSDTPVWAVGRLALAAGAGLATYLLVLPITSRTTFAQALFIIRRTLKLRRRPSTIAVSAHP